MGEGGKLEIDKLFKGLTRPTMILGVSFSFVILEFFIVIIGFIWTSQLKVFLIGALIHGIGFILSHHEPLFLELFAKRLQKCNVCKNRRFHGANSYDVN